jgi:MFS family permease
MALFWFLDRERSIAHPGFSRWLIPPAALSIHLCIGEVYAFSVFKIPLTQLLGINKSLPEDWKQTQLAWIFSLAIVTLGLSAAVFGRWLEDAGPRKAMFAAAACFALGFYISYLGVLWHQLWIIYFGYGFIGGIGLGLGYISPVSTLVQWFPDRPGLATGMAIMGFGGGAMIGLPLAIKLMAYFKTPTGVGVGKTFLVMGSVYFLLMMFGVFSVRVPVKGWKPENWVPAPHARLLITDRNFDVATAFTTRQFWLLWIVLCTNVTAGIGILEQASPLIQELFKGAIGPVAAGGFVGLLSLFNMAGRFFWSTVSDYFGRKPTFVFFALGAVLYFLLPLTGANHLNSVVLFVAISTVLLSMYGGGFATIPAYLRDLFGPFQVGAIHGRLLTAWSVAGVLGPVLVN